MRSEEDVADFKARAFQQYVLKCKCGGSNMDCGCRRKLAIATAAYEGCVPQDFWWIKEKAVTNNRTAFDKAVVPYIENLKKALRHGYGLLFLGDNGVGKTYFISYVLMEAIKKGRTVYFTTMPDLEHNIKRGYKTSVVEERLGWMLTSDFLAIDELGKERVKFDNKYMDAQVERIMKRRLDDGMPMLLSTNMDADSLDKAYGVTVASMLVGKFQSVIMEPGDFRANLRKQMVEEMGYDT